MKSENVRVASSGWLLFVAAASVLIVTDILAGIIFVHGSENEVQLPNDAREVIKSIPKDASTAEFPVFKLRNWDVSDGTKRK